MTKLTSAALFAAVLFAGCATAPAPVAPPAPAASPTAKPPAPAPVAVTPAAPAQPATAVPMGMPPPPRARVSPHDSITTSVGGRGDSRRITITYGRPYSAKGGQGEVRKIWGGLVPWDKADRLGSDEATLLITPVPIMIGETTIPAGAYTLYIVPSENGATKLAFSSNIAKWGIPVDDKHDVARVDLVKSPLENSVDQLTLTFEREVGGADGKTPTDNYKLNIWWEKTKFTLPFSLKS